MLSNAFGLLSAAGAGLVGFTGTRLVQSFGEASAGSLVMNTVGVLLVAGLTLASYKAAPKP
jgi:hypothetical protein